MAEETKNLYAVNLLIALLTRLPELDSVEYDGQKNELGFTIDVRPREETDALFERFKENLSQIFKAYSHLEEISPSKINTKITPLGNEWWSFSIWLSLSELQFSFIVLLTQWWYEFLEGSDFNSNRPMEKITDDEKIFQEEMIENMIQIIQNEGLAYSFRGIREKHQIVVFQKK